MKRKKVKFIHWSDNHIGYSRFDIVDKNGVNQRATDFYNTFNQAIDIIIDKKPDFTINSGDIIDMASVGNRTRDIFDKGLARLDKSGIKTIVLSGTHDVPKSRRDAHLFEISEFENIQMITQPDLIEMSVEGQKVNIYCVPYSINHEEMCAWFDDTVNDTRDANAYNILVLHCDVSGVAYTKNSTNVLVLPEDIGDRYDYVAMGHFHSHHLWNGKNNVVFAGATERQDFNEAGEGRYVHEVTLDNKVMVMDSIPLNIRGMVRIIIDLTDINDVESAMDKIKKSVKNSRDALNDGAIVQMVYRSTFELFKGINLKAIQSTLLPNSLRVVHQREDVAKTDVARSSNSNVSGNIVDEWRKSIDIANEEKESKKSFYVTGKIFLEEAMK